MSSPTVSNANAGARHTNRTTFHSPRKPGVSLAALNLLSMQTATLGHYLLQSLCFIQWEIDSLGFTTPFIRLFHQQTDKICPSISMNGQMCGRLANRGSSGHAWPDGSRGIGSAPPAGPNCQISYNDRPQPCFSSVGVRTESPVRAHHHKRSFCPEAFPARLNLPGQRPSRP